MQVNSKIIRTARRFIEELAEEPVEVFKFMSDEETFIGYDEDNNIVFVKINASYDEFPKPISREIREEIMCKGMHMIDVEGEALIRFNEISFAIISDNRALVRYEINAR